MGLPEPPPLEQAAPATRASSRTMDERALIPAHLSPRPAAPTPAEQGPAVLMEGEPPCQRKDEREFIRPLRRSRALFARMGGDVLADPVQLGLPDLHEA